MSRGHFIVLEGGDGVGKSTQLALLSRWLDQHGVAHLSTRQPGGTPFGAKLRELVLDPATGDVGARAEALVYAADKAQHVTEVVEPALARGVTVVSDRYVDSMIAYQGAGRDLALDEVERLAQWATGGLRPDLTVVLDVHPRDALRRITKKDRLEDAGDEFHLRTREHFLSLAASDPGRYLVVDSSGTHEQVAAQISRRVAELLGLAL